MRRAVVTVKPDDWPVMGCLTGICTACISEEEKGYVSIFIITMVISVLFSGCSHLKPRLNSASIVISYVRNFFTLAIFYLFMI